MKISTARAVFVVVGLGLAGESAAATPPARCDTPRERQGFGAGVISGHGLMRLAWDQVDDCDHLEDFADVVMNNLDRLTIPPKLDDDVICLLDGILHGVEAGVGAVWRRCEGDCSAEGRLIGRIGGKLYCDLSIRLGGLEPAEDVLRRPTRTCGLFFQVACDSELTGFTRRYSSSSGQCLPYTEGAYEQVFRRARANQCVYDAAPP